MKQIVATYIRRFQVMPPQIIQPPEKDLSMIVVIPAYKEPDITKTLAALYQCEVPPGSVEIIVVINAPENADPAVIKINHKTVEQIDNWQITHGCSWIRLFYLLAEGLDAKKAGAGWARKIGMDEALIRWNLIGRDGPILCLDADCEVSPDYFTVAGTGFNDPNLQLAHFHFEHRYEEERDLSLRSGIIQYELHLRCYIQGLKWAGYPFARHTVGSCMAVRATTYARSGGMNRRKAGEDFYFMHKLLPVSNFIYLPARVYPSCRISDRVPFGTGRAQLEFTARINSEKLTYDPRIYQCLKSFFNQVPQLYDAGPHSGGLSVVLSDVLQEINFDQRILELRKQSSSEENFIKRFWQWMDGFMVLKLTHYLRDRHFTSIPVLKAAPELLRLFGETSLTKDLPDLLDVFRDLDQA
ncbi:hypothetical protein SAMN04488057_103166 [Cyclobacterium lianum]|uniref:Glycosyl transferase family 2 n=1 Tax=Cyclobacterium lianum TaxID=388280 RepID=A0A1M7L9Q6_9BACT|nr:family 2 glycosyl transferase [Cyclobacterium lianum]SHM74303.1 hypothetical protein SAMN04488057_103166 [Cyclobacterium lianum]